MDAQRNAPDDPPDPVLRDDVLQLASETPLERVQANNRIKQAGAEGLVAVADFLDDTDATPVQLVEAIRLLASADLAVLDNEQVNLIRDSLAVVLQHTDGRVRVEAARALRIHGPGVHRTLFLTAIADSESRVRWAVVRRFQENPSELDGQQRGILLNYLDARTREEFTSADTDNNGAVSRREFRGTAEAFNRLDRDGNGEISESEWNSPYLSEVRADVVALILGLHSKLTPNERPPSYNPWLASSDQLAELSAWRQWNERVADSIENE